MELQITNGVQRDVLHPNIFRIYQFHFSGLEIFLNFLFCTDIFCRRGSGRMKISKDKL